MSSMQGNFREEVGNPEYNDKYISYQQNNYSVNPRESDKVIGELIRDEISKFEKPRVLDIGCCTGNLLSYLNKLYGNSIELYGGDISESYVEIASKREDLNGMKIEVMDIFSLAKDNFDIVICNAVFYCMTYPRLKAAFRSVYEALKEDGVLITFDWAHPFRQELEIIEHSADSFVDGLRLSARSYNTWNKAFNEEGFVDAKFLPFEMPFELEMDASPESLKTYTMKTDKGKIHSMRGTLLQPWCHIVANKKPHLDTNLK